MPDAPNLSVTCLGKNDFNTACEYLRLVVREGGIRQMT